MTTFSDFWNLSVNISQFFGEIKLSKCHSVQLYLTLEIFLHILLFFLIIIITIIGWNVSLGVGREASPCKTNPYETADFRPCRCGLSGTAGADLIFTHGCSRLRPHQPFVYRFRAATQPENSQRNLAALRLLGDYQVHPRTHRNAQVHHGVLKYCDRAEWTELTL